MVHKRYVLPLLLLVVSGAVGCRNDSLGGNTLINVDREGLREGIVGEVVKSPIMPVERDGQKNWAPLGGALIKVQWEAGGPLGTAVSDSNGQFTIKLIPGTYILTPQPIAGAMFPTPPESQTVEVPEQGVATVRFDYDTGIR